MKTLSRVLIVWMLALAPLTVFSMSIVDARYDAATDELVVKIAYRGSHAAHSFTVAWEACRTMSDGRREILGILLDSDPKDPARTEFTKVERISLRDLACRPATLFIGLASHVDRRMVVVPARSAPKGQP